MRLRLPKRTQLIPLQEEDPVLTRREALQVAAGAGIVVSSAVAGGNIRHAADNRWMGEQWRLAVANAEAAGAARAIAAEQDATLIATEEAQRLVSALNASEGAYSIRGSLLNGTVTLSTKDGAAIVRHPFLLSSYGGPGTTWLGYQQTVEGRIVIGFVPIRDDTSVAIDQAHPILDAQLYTAPGLKGGSPDQAWPLVFGADMDNAPPGPVAVLQYQP